jgi:hypothetical protein
VEQGDEPWPLRSHVVVARKRALQPPHFWGKRVVTRSSNPTASGEAKKAFSNPFFFVDVLSLQWVSALGIIFSWETLEIQGTCMKQRGRLLLTNNRVPIITCCRGNFQSEDGILPISQLFRLGFRNTYSESNSHKA